VVGFKSDAQSVDKQSADDQKSPHPKDTAPFIPTDEQLADMERDFARKKPS
jgi:hypothetical protein